MALQIRKAGTEDIPKIMRLFNAYTAPPKSAYFFEWWNSLPSVTFCAESGDEIVGLFVVLRRKLINHLNCGVLMGLIVHKEWRGRGLFKELGDRAMDYYDDIDLFCCLTNFTGKKALENNFGFNTIGDIKTMIMPSYAYSNKDSECPQHICTPIASGTKFYNFKYKNENTMMFLADKDFRRWRFAFHPRYSYQLLQTDSDGFIITNIYYDKETEIRYGDIIDFEASGLEEDSIATLINCACLNLRKDVDMITIQAVPNGLLHRVVTKMGFVESSIRHFFCVSIKDYQNDYLHNFSNWLIKWGDYLR